MPPNIAYKGTQKRVGKPKTRKRASPKINVDTARINRSDVFLTYGKVLPRMDPPFMLKKFQEIAGDYGIEEYLISQEVGSLRQSHHIHAYLKFKKKFDLQDKDSTKKFDFKYWGVNYHPNIQRPVQKFKLWRYIKKDKDYITNIDETRPRWLTLVEDCDNDLDFYTEVMWTVNRLDNYAGYSTLVKLWKIKSDMLAANKFAKLRRMKSPGGD